jgi:hypothetical protein
LLRPVRERKARPWVPAPALVMLLARSEVLLLARSEVLLPVALVIPLPNGCPGEEPPEPPEPRACSSGIAYCFAAGLLGSTCTPGESVAGVMAAAGPAIASKIGIETAAVRAPPASDLPSLTSSS